MRILVIFKYLLQQISQLIEEQVKRNKTYYNKWCANQFLHNNNNYNDNDNNNGNEIKTNLK